ncbi:MAG TPA: sigma-70 family RNA polymerase sigma factor [Terriglobales bacterium]
MAAPPSSSGIQELVAGCVRGEAASWEAFLARTQPVVARACRAAARQWGMTDPALVEELVQETYTRLVSGRLLETFEPKHPDAIFGYLKLLASRIAHDTCKAAAAGKRGGKASTVPLEDTASPTAGNDVEDDILLNQIEAGVRAASSGKEVDRDLLVFQLYYRLGLTAAAIAAIPSLGLTVKGVESFLSRLTRQVREKFSGGGEREKAAHGD